MIKLFRYRDILARRREREGKENARARARAIGGMYRVFPCYDFAAIEARNE